MGELILALLLVVCGSTAVFAAMRYNRYLVSHDEQGSVMFFLFGRTGLRVFWVVFGLLLVIGGILVFARGVHAV